MDLSLIYIFESITIPASDKLSLQNIDQMQICILNILSIYP